MTLIAGESKSKVVKDALEVFGDLEDVILVTSSFTFTEVAKVLIHGKKENPKAVAKKLNKINRENCISGFNFEIVPTSPDSAYTFEDFWVSVSENMNLYNPGWADAVHCVIMKNNSIKEILSMDGKDDFEIVSGITLIHPKDVKL
ncbi:MAG: type II toxin-antitoxin system VapC family toxin [Candidatus Pacebacteria bacterium]|nr:type II toxin-antitoxin system VapC family toxin [Candidatus Paceibacterota bacterium]